MDSRGKPMEKIRKKFAVGFPLRLFGRKVIFWKSIRRWSTTGRKAPE